jgi:teichuronic acid biosynthesis glycosyltransferase TuaG
MNDLVSIITPSYNSANYIGATIESIISQTYINWELIITDDCSTDQTIALIKSFQQKDKRIKLFENDVNSGAGVTRNNCIKHANGRYIAFCDSDDQWKPEKLERQLSFMLENNYAFTFTAYDVINELNEPKGVFIPPPKVTYHSLLQTCSIGCLTVIYDTKQLGKHYMPEIRKRQDYALWLKLIKQTKLAYGLTEPLAIYRSRSHSISSNKIKAAQFQWRIYREVEKLGFLASLYYFVHYAYFGIRKVN